jgi:hypothetical protein
MHDPVGLPGLTTTMAFVRGPDRGTQRGDVDCAKGPM